MTDNDTYSDVIERNCDRYTVFGAVFVVGLMSISLLLLGEIAGSIVMIVLALSWAHIDTLRCLNTDTEQTDL